MGKKTTVNNGDLVQVIHLDKSMYHFNISVGIVTDKKRDKFGITFINNKGKIKKDSTRWWYDTNNVKVLIPGYKRGVLDGKVVYKDVPDLKGILRKAFSEIRAYEKVVTKLHDEALKELFGF